MFANLGACHAVTDQTRRRCISLNTRYLLQQKLDLDAMWSGNQSRSRAEPLLKIVVDRSLGHYMYPTELLP